MKKKILIALGALILISSYLYLEARFLKPGYINVRKETISDDSIPDSFNNFEIVFFSDLTCDENTDLEKIAQKINNLNPDIVIFGGDVISESSYLYTEENVKKLTEFFKSIEANYAKYAVFGEKDTSSEFVKNSITKVFTDSGFEVLNNKAVRFRINATDYINIVGLEDYVTGSLALSSSFSNIKPDTYTLVVSHSPDIFTELTGTKTNLLLAGHSLGGKALIPLFGPLNRIEGSNRYYNGSYTLQDMKLDVTSGVYTGDGNLRFLTTNEIVSYKIKKDIIEVEEVETTDNQKENTSEDNKTESTTETQEKENVKPEIIEENENTSENNNSSRPGIENVFD